MVEHNLSMSLNHHVPIFKRTLTGVGGPRLVSNPSLLLWCHLFWVMWPCFMDHGHFSEWRFQWLSAYTTDPLHLRQRSTPPPRPPPTWKEHVFFLLLCRQALLLTLSRSEINLSITHECKGYLSCDLKERVLHFCYKFLCVRLQRYLKNCNVCFFWLEQFKSQGKLFSLEDNKNDLDGNELTQHHCLVSLFFCWCFCLHRC